MFMYQWCTFVVKGVCVVGGGMGGGELKCPIPMTYHECDHVQPTPPP